MAAWLFQIQDFESIKTNFENVLRTVPETPTKLQMIASLSRSSIWCDLFKSIDIVESARRRGELEGRCAEVTSPRHDRADPTAP
jgi:hypothetical protein